MIFAEHFRVKWRKRLTVMFEEFDKSMRGFWVAVFEGDRYFSWETLPTWGKSW